MKYVSSSWRFNYQRRASQLRACHRCRWVLFILRIVLACALSFECIVRKGVSATVDSELAFLLKGTMDLCCLPKRSTFTFFILSESLSVQTEVAPLTYFWWPHVWECIYQPSHLFQPWRGQQAPMEMQGGCHWPSCRSALASLLYQQARQTGRVKNWALANTDKRRFSPRNPSARGKRCMNDRRFIAALVY